MALTGLLLQQVGLLATILCFEGVLGRLAVAATFTRALRKALLLSDP